MNFDKKFKLNTEHIKLSTVTLFKAFSQFKWEFPE